MKKHLVTCGLAALLSFVGLSAQATNQLTDPGFEDPLLYTFDGPPFVGFWEGFSAGGAASSGHDTTFPLNGTGHSTLSILGDDNSFTGVFQDIPVLAGGQVDGSIWHASPDSALGVGSEFRIEFHDAGGEIARVTNDGNVPTATYSQISVGGVAPAGTVSARLVYAIQTFGGEPFPTNTGTVYLDDASLTGIPEPTAAIMALLGLAPLARRRR